VAQRDDHVGRRDQVLGAEILRMGDDLAAPRAGLGLAELLLQCGELGRDDGRHALGAGEDEGGIDPVGACVGPRGSRVRMVVSELRGEKIDIIPYNEEPARFVAKALSPARVREVLVDDEEMQATVVVPDDQLSLAIGRDGQNARLAARLTGWRVDIKSETEFAQEEDQHDYDGDEEFDGRCMAVLSSGRRCPNESIEGSTFCGLPQHQALSRFETNHVAVLDGLGDAEVTMLADPDADEAEVSAVVTGAEEGFVEPVPEAEAEAEEIEESTDEAVEEEAEESAEDTVEEEVEESTEEAVEEEVEEPAEDAVEEEVEVEDLESGDEVVEETVEEEVSEEVDDGVVTEEVTEAEAPSETGAGDQATEGEEGAGGDARE